MNIAICDDSLLDQQIIKQYCEDAGEHNITLFSSGEVFLNNAETFDLLFLDIEMKNLDGIDVMHSFELKHSNMLIVFCTSHQEKSIETHGKNVINFLTKPVTAVEISNCINKARKLFNQFFIITVGDKGLLCGDILYIHVESPYTVFYTKNGKTYFSSNPLQKWIDELQDLPFHRISRSCLVNFQNTLDITKNRLLLCSGKCLPISRRLVTFVADAYKTYHREQMRY